MEKLIVLRLYDNLSMKTYDLSKTNNDEVIGIMDHEPEGTLFIFTGENPSKSSIIMCPGGGFNKVSVENEGLDLVEWFTKRDFNFIVFKYRLPSGNPDVPKQDIQLALKSLREKFPDLCENLGVMGASIGGYYAACAATMLPDDELPDFQILMFGMVSMDDHLAFIPCRDRMFGDSFTESKVKKYSPLDHVTPNAAPAFIVAAGDDAVVKPLNSILYASKLQEKSVPISLHIYPTGGHAFDFKDSFIYKAQFLTELDAWLKRL